MNYLILPDCSDFNRGDQALIWETIRIAKDAGFEGDYYIQSNNPSSCMQSESEGIHIFPPILKHPSRKKGENNINYRKVLFKWGFTALCDLFFSLWVLFIIKFPFLDWMLGRNIRKTIELYRSSGAVFVKGGGFIHSFGGITAFYFIYYHMYPIYLAHRLNIPVFIMPNSFGPIDGFLCKWQVKRALQKCKLIYCREHISYEYMIKTFPTLDFRVSFDLGFYLQKQEKDINILFPQGKKKVAITVRPYRFPEFNNGRELYKKYIESIIGFCERILVEDYFPVFIQHTIALNKHEDDMQSIKEITSRLPSGKFGVFSDTSYNCREMKFLYSKFDYIVGTRFHSAIFSMAENVPAIAIAYGGNKTRGIMRDLGLSNYVIGIEEITENNLFTLFTNLVANEESVRKSLKKNSIKISLERRKLISSLNKVLYEI